MHFYGMADTQVLAMPIRRFWMLHRNVDRITAEENTRSLHIAASAQSGEAVTDLMKRLEKRVGSIVEFATTTEEGVVYPVDVSRDQAGIDEFKMMGKVVASGYQG